MAESISSRIIWQFRSPVAATVAVAKIELARIRRSAAVPSFGMCPEPAPIKPDNFIQRARHCDGARKCVASPLLPRPHEFRSGERTNLQAIISDEQRRKRNKP
ncbi:MAG: hypothetical protein K0R41_675 [Geminicoccaceae bacterium]|nr:hypothetical protein [Geminicoccaceae bacterium]